MRNIAQMLGFAVVAAGLLAGTPARADWDHDHRWHRDDRVIIRDNDRAYLRGYIGEHRVYCPAGFFSRHRNCIVPHGRVVFYNRGSYLPSDVVYTELPGDVVARLSPAPPGAVYVRANDNIYLINRRDRTVLDAINLFADLQ